MGAPPVGDLGHVGWMSEGDFHGAHRSGDRKLDMAKDQPVTAHLSPTEVTDAIRGLGVLFGRDDIVDAQWRIVEPVLDDVTPVYPYAPGTWGPDGTEALIGADGPWRNPQLLPRKD